MQPIENIQRDFRFILSLDLNLVLGDTHHAGNVSNMLQPCILGNFKITHHALLLTIHYHSVALDMWTDYNQDSTSNVHLIQDIVEATLRNVPVDFFALI